MLDMALTPLSGSHNTAIGERDGVLPVITEQNASLCGYWLLAWLGCAIGSGVSISGDPTQIKSKQWDQEIPFCVHCGREQ